MYLLLENSEGRFKVVSGGWSALVQRLHLLGVRLERHGFHKVDLTLDPLHVTYSKVIGDMEDMLFVNMTVSDTPPYKEDLRCLRA